MSNKEFSEKLKAGIELAGKRMLQDKALRGEDVIVSSDGKTIQRIPAKDLIAETVSLEIFIRVHCIVSCEFYTSFPRICVSTMNTFTQDKDCLLSHILWSTSCHGRDKLLFLRARTP